MDSAVSQEMIIAGRFSLYLGAFSNGRVDDPDQYFTRLQCGSVQSGLNWCSKEFDRLYAEQSATVDMVKRSVLVRQMQDILLDEMPMVDVWWAGRIGAWWNYARDFPNEERSGQHSQARRLEYVWLDK